MKASDRNINFLHLNICGLKPKLNIPEFNELIQTYEFNELILLSHLYLGALGVSIEEVECIPLFLSAMPRGVAVANIYVVNQLLNLTLMVDNFL